MSEVDITIYLNNKWHAQRRWPTVPRVGDKIAVRDGVNVIVVKVKEVIWGAIDEDFLGYQICTVGVYCKL